MRKYFYNLYFCYSIDNSQEKAVSNFNIGYFSSQLEAKKVIEKLKTQPGFCDYSIDCFVIRKCAVNFSKEICSKKEVVLYVLTHEYMTDEFESIWTEFGLFEDKKAAIVELSKHKNKEPYKNYLEGFDISKWRVDKDIQWQEGFSHEDD
ncbi:hypothetical protein [Pumilibacter muris]|uniref:hypothetical protein n=1 Tax=Pumilibacter muris TaxID=2941510 RepID=UPI00203B01F8|nr:hypothetical protein [Pumilibacter muris]